MIAMDDSHSAVVAEIYDPSSLRVRVDVPLSEAGSLTVGQPTSITTSLLPGQTFRGTVELIVGMADIQRNTLQAKVTIQDPDPRMRPDTLCRVAFLAPESNEDAVTSSVSSVWIPVAVVGDREDSATVWVVDPETDTVAQRTLQLGSSIRKDLREVMDGLRVNEHVVVSSERPLQEGERVTRREEQE
jgi:multidrug efflux pump subunit AcrA (membrane-fusion protein)